MLQGKESLERKLEKLAQLKLQKGLEKATLRVERDAKLLAPVDTGFTKASINSTVRENYGEVYAGTEYALFLELGTWKMPAQPFMFPALEQNKEKIIEDLASDVREALK